MAFWGAKQIEEDPDERGRVFVWTREKGVALHLFAFLVFSFLIHGAGFYLFKVVYPAPGRVENRPQTVFVMDAADPAVRPVVQRVVDRTVYLLPPSENSEARIGIDRDIVRFRPEFEADGLELAPPPSPFALRAGELPPPRPPETGRDNDSVRIDPALSDRALAPWSLLHDYLSLAEGLPALRLSVEIGADGSVSVGSVDGAIDEEAKSGIAAAVEATLRFEPAETAAAGWIEIGGG